MVSTSKSHPPPGILDQFPSESKAASRFAVTKWQREENGALISKTDGKESSQDEWRKQKCIFAPFLNSDHVQDWDPYLSFLLSILGCLKVASLQRSRSFHHSDSCFWKRKICKVSRQKINKWQRDRAAGKCSFFASYPAKVLIDTRRALCNYFYFPSFPLRSTGVRSQLTFSVWVLEDPKISSLLSAIHAQIQGHFEPSKSGKYTQFIRVCRANLVTLSCYWFCYCNAVIDSEISRPVPFEKTTRRFKRGRTGLLSLR